MLKAEVEDLGQVDAKYHDLYVEVDGGYKLNVDNGDVSGLKSALDKERRMNKEARRLLKKYETIDPDKYEELLAREEELDKTPPKTRWLKEKEQLTRALQEKDELLKRHTIENTIKQTALTAGVNPEDLDDVIALTRNNFTIVDGEIEVLDEKGQVASYDVDKFFKDIYKNKKPKYYMPSGRTGGGAQQTGGKGPTTIESQYQEAMKKGDVLSAIQIKNKMYKR